ncbi:MAG: cytochrome c-type biogenesis protein CcmH [Proteobacteria bacterium]|nr:cytochrome c-type biogenesis protein CcmH [Pseudomonadota bacterium]
MKKRFLIIAFIAVATLTASYPVSLLAGDTQSEIEETLICLCGCGQTIKNCPHQNCGFAIPAKAKIKEYLSEGKTKDEIIDIFVSQNGEEVLAAPKKEGFNLLGYIMPFLALFAAVGVIVLIIRGWTKTGIEDEEKTLPMAKDDFGSDIDKQIEKELEEMD